MPTSTTRSLRWRRPMRRRRPSWSGPRATTTTQSALPARTTALRGPIDAVYPRSWPGCPPASGNVVARLAVVAGGQDATGRLPESRPSPTAVGKSPPTYASRRARGDMEIAFFGRNRGVAGQRGIGSGGGTSYAAPMVAGGLAVMKQLFRGQLGNEELVGRLYATASKEGPFSDASVYGQGLMDLGAATSPVGRAMLTTGRTVSAPGTGVQATGMSRASRSATDWRGSAGRPGDRRHSPSAGRILVGCPVSSSVDPGPTLAEHLRGLAVLGSRRARSRDRPGKLWPEPIGAGGGGSTRKPWPASAAARLSRRISRGGRWAICRSRRRGRIERLAARSRGRVQRCRTFTRGARRFGRRAWPWRWPTGSRACRPVSACWSPSAGQCSASAPGARLVSAHRNGRHVRRL